MQQAREQHLPQMTSGDSDITNSNTLPKMRRPLFWITATLIGHHRFSGSHRRQLTYRLFGHIRATDMGQLNQWTDR